MTFDGYRQDAEAFGRLVVEIVTRRKPKIWRAVLTTPDEEARYVYWAARWAAHWAGRELARRHST